MAEKTERRERPDEGGDSYGQGRCAVPVQAKTATTELRAFVPRPVCPSRVRWREYGIFGPSVPLHLPGRSHGRRGQEIRAEPGEAWAQAIRK